LIGDHYVKLTVRIHISNRKSGGADASGVIENWRLESSIAIPQ
jgi:hypothetical protein